MVARSRCWWLLVASCWPGWMLVLLVSRCRGWYSGLEKQLEKQLVKGAAPIILAQVRTQLGARFGRKARFGVECLAPEFQIRAKGERIMLLGQAAAANTPLLWVLLGVAGGVSLLLLVVFFLVLLFRHLASVRQLTHAERMKTLEAGFPLEPAEEMKAHAKFMHNAFWISFWLVFSVPAAALSAASTATTKVNGSTTLTAIIWTGGAAASIAAVVGATVLMLSTRARQEDDVSGPSKMKKLL